jgi:hypothetical protein
VSYAGTRALARLAGRTRIVVGGVDVQYFRDYSTPMPRYTLTEPFAYGATSIQFPQVHMGYEQAGVGDLAWAHEGAAVTISRVFDDGSETVDYRGRVISVEAAGRVLNLDVGGQFSGPANTLEEQTLMYRQSLDVGRYASLAAGRCGLSFSPWFGPATGIELTHSGGQSLLSWAQYLGAMSQDVSGQQRALMPTVWGGNTWGFEVKDYTTRHFTAFNDDARVVVEVSQDASEAPNVIYGTGITPDGERITNAKWPGVFAGPPPDYPMAGNVNFGSGTTDGDTVNGDGITVLYVKLREMGYLPFQIENTGVYTSDIVAAVRKLQRDVGLTVTGTMTLAAWKRLFNVDYTGYSINGARIAPLAADPRVEEFLYTSNGSVAGRNPDYDPTILRVERTIDFGSGITKSAMIAYAQGILARSSSLKNWVGTIRLNGAGVFTGSHDSGTGLTEADLMPYRDIRPGMNVWVPYFDGGTLFHVAGVDVDDAGATLTVDTQARDLVEVRQIMERDRDSRRDPRRDWFASNRTRKLSSAMIACDEGFGWIDRKVALEGGKWNVIPVIAGQQGQVNRVDIRLTNDPAEFAVAAFSRQMTRKRLAHKIGNPLTTGDESVWETSDIQDWFDDRILLYATGDGKQPCGYGKRRKRDDAGNLTGAPLTGRLLDDSPWPYICAAHTAVIVYVAIYPDRDCTLKRGRILYPQLDDAA